MTEIVTTEDGPLARLDRVHELCCAALRQHPTAEGRDALRVAVVEIEGVREQLQTEGTK